MRAVGAAIEQAAPIPAPTPDRPQVIPLAIFAAQRERFECLVRGFASPGPAKAIIFNALPLEAYGWTREGSRVRHLRNIHKGMIFLVERG